MIKTLNVSYGITDETKVSVGEFEVEIYDEIENSLESIIKVLAARISLKKINKINITIEEISCEDDS